MTTYEILIGCKLSKGVVYKQIEKGLIDKTFREWTLDFTPFHKRKVRLIGLEIEGVKFEWYTGHS